MNPPIVSVVMVVCDADRFLAEAIESILARSCPETENFLYYKGLYGIGSEGPQNRPLVENIRMLASGPDQLPALGALSLKFVRQYFSLEVISEQLAAIFESAVVEQRPPTPSALTLVKSVALYLRHRRFRWRYTPRLRSESLTAQKLSRL
jgi:hypothetical protein